MGLAAAEAIYLPGIRVRGASYFNSIFEKSNL